MSQEGGTNQSLALAKADRRAARKRLPVCDERNELAAVSLSEPKSREMRGFIPQTQLSSATGAVLNDNTISQVMAALSVRAEQFRNSLAIPG